MKTKYILITLLIIGLLTGVQYYFHALGRIINYFFSCQEVGHMSLCVEQYNIFANMILEPVLVVFLISLIYFVIKNSREKKPDSDNVV